MSRQLVKQFSTQLGVIKDPTLGTTFDWKSGAPSNSTDVGFSPGGIMLDVTNGIAYINTGSKTASTWQKFAYSGETIAALTVTTLTVTTMAGTPNFSGAVTMATTLGVTGVITPTGGIAAAASSSASPCGQIHTGGYPAIISTSGTELTPGAGTTAYITEIFIPCNMTITGVNHFNGSAVTGNITIGLYTAAGQPIAAALTAATAGSGTDAYQTIAFAAPYAAIGPAKYLIAFLYSSTSARPNCHLIGTLWSLSQATFTVGTTVISPLPTAFTATTAPMASLY